MKKKFQTVFSLLMVCVCLLSTVVPCFAAEGTVEDAPYVKNTSFLQVNAKENDSTVYADGYDHGYIPNIRTVQNSDGSYTVCVNETAKSSNQLRIVEFSAERQQLSSVVIPMELEMYVCFTKGTNNGKYYVLFANKEAKEKTDLIMRLVEYDTNGTKKRSLDFKGNAPASFNGINTIGCGNGDLYADDTLITGYVGRFMFPIPGDPNWHQSSYSFAVRTSDFVQIEKPSSAYIPYASHSFHQAIIPDGDSYLYVDRCDALPYRSFVFAKMKGVNWDLTTNCSVIYPEYPSPDDTKPKAHSFLFKGVEDGEGYYSNNTYSQYGGLIVLEDKYMLVGSYQNDETVLTESSANLFVQFLDKDTMSPIADPTYLTDWSDIEGQPPCYRTINNPKAVKISENRVAIIYSLCNKSFSSTQTRLMMIDASGKVLSDKAVESSVGDSLIVPRFGKVYYNQSKEAIEWFTVQNGTLIMRSIETKDPVAAKPFSQVSALYFQTQTLDLLIHESKQLLPNILPTTAGNRITWTSDNEAVITVDSMGTVIGIGNGTATVTATAPNGLAARISVSVTGGKPATGISVEFAKPEQEMFTPSNAMAVQKGDYYGIYATVTPLDASNRTVSVSSTRPDVVYVAPNGTYWQAVGTGTAFLTVASYSDPDVKLTYRITVYAPGETPEIPDIYSSDEVISFGSYPQSFVADESMIAVLNRESNALAWTSYGYYSGTGSADDGNMAPGDYMKYKDFTYNGEKYRAVTFTSFRPTSTGKACSADTSVQDDNGFAENAVYFFKYEPLTWRVLDPKTGYMVCTKAIDSQAYQNYVYQSFNTQVAQISASDWETSSLKKWLNEDFYNAAFSDSEKEQIVAIKSLTSTSSTLVSLLSESDVLNGDYGYKTDAAASDTIRRMTATDYAKCQGVSVSAKDGTAAWWINAPKDEGNTIVVEADGSCMD
ncbi:MAG TPA: hypothetical protein DDY98_08405, partial [Ruminococcaceae bacterium]|nr:hypothetical protein [Oscillospiraceae bacterium]